MNRRLRPGLATSKNNVMACALAAMLAAGLVASARADVYVINTNQWVGTVSSDWFNPLNWYLGDKYAAPLTQLNTWISPILNVSAGVPPNTYVGVPLREAVLGQAFSANHFRMIGWDGLSQLRLTQGGLLYTSDYVFAEVGNDNLVSVNGGQQQKANLILDGGSLSGYWNFHANARVEVRGQYSQAQGDWNGTLGELAITAGSSFNGGSLTHTVVNHITNDGVLKVQGNQTLKLAGEVVNNGVVAPVSATSILSLQGNTTLTGQGTTYLSGYTGAGNATMYVPASPYTLTVDTQQTLRGTGHLAFLAGGGLVNKGTLFVDNRGTAAVDAKELQIELGSGGVVDNTSGRITVADGARLWIYGGSVRGGVIESTGSSILRGNAEGVTFGAGGFKYDGALSGNTAIAPGARLSLSIGSSATLAGALRNDGTLVVGAAQDLGGGLMQSSSLQLTQSTTLAGSGTTVLTNNVAIVGGDQLTLTIAAGQAVRGGGYFYGANFNLLNRGVLSAQSDGLTGNTATMTFASSGGSLSNEGLVDIATGSRLNMPGQVLHQTSAQAVTHVDGTLTVGTLDLAAGTLNGSGTIAGMVIVGGGTVSPGNSPGKLTVNGSLIMGDESTLLMQVYGNEQGLSYDWLQVNGNVSLNGKLLLDFGAYQPQVGDSFEFLSYQGDTVSGAFDAVLASGYELSTTFDGGHLTVKVDAISPVPEPDAWLLWLSGLGALVAVARRRAAMQWQRMGRCWSLSDR